MLIIRFARRGRRNRAFFDLVVAEKTRAVKKKFVEKLGYYDPHCEGGKGKFVFDSALVEKYISNGAQVSDSAAKRLVKNGFSAAEKFVERRVSKPPKPVEKAEEKTEEPPAEAAPDETASE